MVADFQNHRCTEIHMANGYIDDLARVNNIAAPVNAAMYHEIDAVIDPRDTRAYLLRALKTMPVGKKGSGESKGKRPFIPTW